MRTRSACATNWRPLKSCRRSGAASTCSRTSRRRPVKAWTALLDSVLLQAEVLDLKALWTTGPAAGVVIESSLEKGRGAVATILVTRGTARRPATCHAGRRGIRSRAAACRTSPVAKTVSVAGPSTPVAAARPVGYAELQAMTCWCSKTSARRGSWPSSAMPSPGTSSSRSSRPQKLGDVFSQMGSAEATEPAVVRQGGRARQCRGPARCAEKLSNDEVTGEGHQQWRRRHHRERCEPGGGFQRNDHRLQRSGGRVGAHGNQGDRCRSPLLLDHLRGNRRCEVRP